MFFSTHAHKQTLKITLAGVLLTFCELPFIGGCDATEEEVQEGVETLELDLLGYNATPVTGERALLVIVTEFSDVRPQDRDYDSLFFGDLDLDAANPSLNGLYRSVSGGKFGFKSAGILRVAFDQTWATATADVSAYDKDVLLKAAAAGIKFHLYDTDGDGITTHRELAIVLVNPGTGCGGQTRSVTVSGETIDGANFQYEGNLSATSEDAGIDLYAHELFHQIEGSEHIYGPGGKLNYRSSFYAGSHCAGQVGPYHLDPWFKMRLGWLKPRLIPMLDLESVNIEFGPADPAPIREFRPIILYDVETRGYNEFFVLEYRAPRDYDVGVNSQGLAVWYVKKGNDHQLIEFDWPPPFTSDGTGMYADYIIGAQKPGYGPFWTQDHEEFSLEWGDGVDSAIRLEVLNRLTPDSPVLEVQVRKSEL